MPNNLTDTEIKKALECCDNCFCENCAYQPKLFNCREELCHDALDLINRLQAENERLSCITRTMVGEIKAEAMTEFAEFLKDYYKDNLFAYEAEQRCEEIDNLLKETVGE